MIRRTFLLILLTLALLPSGCGTWLEDRTPLPNDMVIEQLRDGYPLAQTLARNWQIDSHLESATGIYRRHDDGWKLSRAYYVFVHTKEMQYRGITLDLEARQVVIDPPGPVGGKGSLITTTWFDLVGNPIDDLYALQTALSQIEGISEQCIPDEAIISGRGDVEQTWWVRFKTPRPLDPLFLGTIFVDAVTGDTRVAQERLDNECSIGRTDP